MRMASPLPQRGGIGYSLGDRSDRRFDLGTPGRVRALGAVESRNDAKDFPRNYARRRAYSRRIPNGRNRRGPCGAWCRTPPHPYALAHRKKGRGSSLYRSESAAARVSFATRSTLLGLAGHPPVLSVRRRLHLSHGARRGAMGALLRSGEAGSLFSPRPKFGIIGIG